MPDRIDKALKKLAALIAAGRFENVEDDGLEIKPTPSATSSWRESHKSANAFLNTRGGLLLSLGKVETIKADLAAARGFLARKLFIKDETVTTLGMLVCGQHVGDQLGFRCHVHGYVDAPQEVAQDKQDLIDNILPLMEKSLAYILRNIQIGISIAEGGTAVPQYPEEVLRETVNNALAHRDYSINKQVIISILLTPDNNHFEQLVVLERAGLIYQHDSSTPTQPIFVADRVLMQTDYQTDLEALFGDLSSLDSLSRKCLSIMWRREKFASRKAMTEPEIFLALWHERGAIKDADEFADHVRQVMVTFERLREAEFIVRARDHSGFVLNFGPIRQATR